MQYPPYNDLCDYTWMEPHDRLKKAREAAGFETAEDAAKALNVKYSTYAAHENGTRNFIRNVSLYARRFNTTADWLLTGKPSGNPDRVVGVTQSAPGGGLGRIHQVKVIGTVKASYWQDVTELSDLEEQEVVPAVSDYPPSWQYAFRVDGPSVNRTAKDGDILVCVDIIKSHVPINENDLVIVERLRYGGQMLERTAKRVRKAIAGYELWPDSDDPEFQEPIPLGAGSDEVRVSAKVIWVLRKP